jgi:hypothetical protein
MSNRSVLIRRNELGWRTEPSPAAAALIGRNGLVREAKFVARN